MYDVIKMLAGIALLTQFISTQPNSDIVIAGVKSNQDTFISDRLVGWYVPSYIATIYRVHNIFKINIIIRNLLRKFFIANILNSICAYNIVYVYL